MEARADEEADLDLGQALAPAPPLILGGQEGDNQATAAFTAGAQLVVDPGGNDEAELGLGRVGGHLGHGLASGPGESRGPGESVAKTAGQDLSIRPEAAS